MDQSLIRILDILPQYIGITDANLVCRYANPAYGDLLGRSPASMIGVPIRELWGEKLYAEVLPKLKRALAGESVSFSKRIRHLNGQPRFGKVTLLPEPDGGYIVVMRDLDLVERQNSDRERLLHELDHRVNNILQILLSVLALESQSADERSGRILDAIKARVDALAISYEFLSGAEPAGGWPVALALDKVVTSLGPGIAATASADPKLRLPHDSIENFIFIAMEITRWATVDGGRALLEARRVPEGLELIVEGSEGSDLTTRAGAAGIALVESFASRSEGGPIRGGTRIAIIFPLRGDIEPAPED